MSFQKVAELGSLTPSGTFHNYHLSLSLSKEVFCYALLDLTKQEYTHFGLYKSKSNSYAEQVVELNKLLKENTFFSNEFKSVSCTYVNKGNTLVPSSLYNEESLKTYHDFNIVNTNAEPRNDYLTNLNGYNIYGVLLEAEELFLKYFPSIKQKHYSSIIIESLLTMNHNEKQATVYATVFDSFFDLSIIKEGKLLLNNSFNYHNAEDIAYYLMFVSKELNIDLEEINFSVLGNREMGGELNTILKDYVRNLNMEKVIADASTESIIKDKLIIEFPELFNQYRCV